MMKMNLNIADFQRQLDKMADEVLRLEGRLKFNGEVAVKRVANDIFQESQKLVPVDTHNLKGTARFDKIKDGYEIIYSSPGEATGFNYALIQHEDMTFKHDNGEQAKYLEQPFKNKIGNLEGEIAKETKL